MRTIATLIVRSIPGKQINENIAQQGEVDLRNFSFVNTII